MIISIMGPTASGKTDSAIELAKQFPIEIVSVDSALVYRDMNIGTAKPSNELLQTIPHHLINIINPDQQYTVAMFLRDAEKAIMDIQQRNKIPLLVGGTMMYFKALLEGLTDIPAIPSGVRHLLQQRQELEGLDELYAELTQVDTVAASRIHAHDAQRILRALEVYQATGKTLTEWLAHPIKPIIDKESLLQFALWPEDRAQLHSLLAKRFEQMLEQGFVEEVVNLQAKYQLTAESSSLRCVGYRQVWQYLQGDYNYEEMQLRCIAASRQLAKRQLTWLRTWSPKPIFINAYQPDTLQKMQDIIC